MELKLTRKQKMIAEEAGVSPEHLNRLVKGRYEPKVGLAIRIAKTAGKSVEEMWGHFAISAQPVSSKISPLKNG